MIFPIFHWKKVFENKRPLLATRQAESLQNLFIRAWFNVVPKPVALPKSIRLYNCQDKRCLSHYNSYINHLNECEFKLKSGRYHIWKCNRYFDCKSRDVVYLIICLNC